MIPPQCGRLEPGTLSQGFGYHEAGPETLHVDSSQEKPTPWFTDLTLSGETEETAVKS